jgi:hypothetical protein
MVGLVNLLWVKKFRCIEQPVQFDSAWARRDNFESKPRA